MRSRTATPVTIISGFLGAGKTTLLNHLLTQDHGLQIGVLVNDFGTINIDAQLIEAVADDVINLANGCICCVMREDLMASVWGLLERPDPPNYIVIEASGVADPSAIAFTLASAARHGGIRLDAVVTVVDAEALLTPPLSDEVDALMESQLAVAQLIVLNKTDRVDITQLAVCKKKMADVTGNARILESQYADIPAELLLDVHATDEAFSPAAPPARHASFATWTLDTPRQAISLRSISLAMQQLPEGILRAKGLVSIADMPGQVIVVHRVGQRTDFQPGGTRTRTPGTKLVVIGLPDAIDPVQLDAWAAQWLA